MVKILGHRGDPSRFGANHLDGIRRAAEGADGAEVDLRRCGSGELVLSHDETIDGAVVADTGLEDLRVLDPGLVTGAQLFAADLPGTLDLEVKNGPHERGFEDDHRIAFEVAQHARPDDVVTCFYWPSVDAIVERFPSVRTGLLFDGMPVVDAARHAVENGHRSIAPNHRLIDSQETVQRAQDSGISVMAWTVNARERIVELARWGIDTIITDRPLEAVAWTEELET